MRSDATAIGALGPAARTGARAARGRRGAAPAGDVSGPARRRGARSRRRPATKMLDTKDLNDPVRRARVPARHVGGDGGLHAEHREGDGERRGHRVHDPDACSCASNRLRTAGRSRLRRSTRTTFDGPARATHDVHRLEHENLRRELPPAEVPRRPFQEAPSQRRTSGPRALPALDPHVGRARTRRARARPPDGHHTATTTGRCARACSSSGRTDERCDEEHGQRLLPVRQGDGPTEDPARSKSARRGGGGHSSRSYARELGGAGRCAAYASRRCAGVPRPATRARTSYVGAYAACDLRISPSRFLRSRS